jgi:hypothetical protein
LTLVIIILIILIIIIIIIRIIIIIKFPVPEAAHPPVFFHPTSAFLMQKHSKIMCSSVRRRVVSIRWVGDDARFINRPGQTSPNFPGLDYEDGMPFEGEEFPVLYSN